MITVWRRLPPRPESGLSGPVSSRTLAPRASCLRLCHVLSPEGPFLPRTHRRPPPAKPSRTFQTEPAGFPQHFARTFVTVLGAQCRRLCVSLPSLPWAPAGRCGRLSSSRRPSGVRGEDREAGGERSTHSEHFSVLISFWVFFWVLGVFKETLSYSEPPFHAGLFRAQICWCPYVQRAGATSVRAAPRGGGASPACVPCESL